MNAMTQPKRSLQDDLTWVNEQPAKHEFHRGEVFAITGGRRSHACVIGNLVRHFGNHLDGSPCRGFSEGKKVQIAEDTVLYADVFASCDRAHLATEMIFRSPRQVVEVLSPSTQACDRSQKFALYRGRPSLLEYILIDSDTRRVESFRRNAEEQWVLHDMSDEGALHAASIDARVPLADVFAGIDPAPEAAPEAEPAPSP